MKALVVVAERPTRQLLEAFFLRRGHAAVACIETRRALAAIEAELPQIVFLDLEMSDDPLQLCRHLREQPGGEACYLLALASHETPGCLRPAFEAGIDDYLVKPLTEDSLRLRLSIAERRLARRRQLFLAEARSEHAERRHRTLIETMHEGLFQVDERGVIEFANSRLSEITGYTHQELVGSSAVELLVDPEVREHLPEQTLLGTGTGSEEYSIPLRHKSGERIWVNLTGAPISGFEGQGGGSIGVIEDITAERRALEALRHREEYFRVLTESSSDVISILDLDGRVLYQSGSTERLLGWKPEELVGRELAELVHEDDRQLFLDSFNRALESPSTTDTLQFRCRHRDHDEWCYLEVLCDNLVDNPVVGGVLLTGRDVTERKRVADALERQRAFFQQLFHNSPAGIVILDNSDRVVDANRSFHGLFQFTIDEIAGKPLGSFIVPERYQEEARELSDAVFHQRVVECETVRRRKDGSEVEVSILGYPIALADQRIGAYGIYSDITKRKQAERSLFHEAFHDGLTGLPNRTLMTERLERALRRSQRGDYHFALMFIDLDRFKVINDSLGHAAGDQLLVEMARRLEQCLRPGDTVARLGGDEFTVILEDVEDHADATRVAKRILSALGEPFHVAGQDIVSSGSIGIASSLTGYERAEDVIRDADIAMYRAKARGKARYEIFDSEMHKSAVERLRLETSLRRAIEREQLLLHYQPVVSLATGRLAGFEALVRWHHPERGLLGPGHLIPVAEETGIIVPLGRWVFREACRQLAGWQRRFGQREALRVSVNASVKEITHPDFLEGVWSVLRETEIEPSSIAVEITESLMMKAADSILDVLWQLRRRGLHLYVDDFGTGYSSLSSLQGLPIDAFKIDRSFISGMSPTGGGFEIVRAIAGLGENLGLSVIAEGVETDEQRQQLGELGLVYAQGYLFSKPLPADEAEALIERDPRW